MDGSDEMQQPLLLSATGQVNRELVYVLIWFLITLDSFQSVLFTLQLLFSTCGQLQASPNSVCYSHFFSGESIERSSKQKSCEGFVLRAHPQPLLASLHFPVAISNLAAHCLSIPLGCQIFRIYNGMINWQGNTQPNNRLQRTSY